MNKKCGQPSEVFFLVPFILLLSCVYTRAALYKSGFACFARPAVLSFECIPIQTKREKKDCIDAVGQSKVTPLSLTLCKLTETVAGSGFGYLGCAKLTVFTVFVWFCFFMFTEFPCLC